MVGYIANFLDVRSQANLKAVSPDVKDVVPDEKMTYDKIFQLLKKNATLIRKYTSPNSFTTKTIFSYKLDLKTEIDEYRKSKSKSEDKDKLKTALENKIATENIKKNNIQYTNSEYIFVIPIKKDFGTIIADQFKKYIFTNRTRGHFVSQMSPCLHVRDISHPLFNIDIEADHFMSFYLASDVSDKPGGKPIITEPPKQTNQKRTISAKTKLVKTIKNANKVHIPGHGLRLVHKKNGQDFVKIRGSLVSVASILK